MAVVPAVRQSDQGIPRGIFATASLAIQQYGFLGTVARYLLMRQDMRRFVQRGKTSTDQAFRRELLRRFHTIQNKIVCAHSPYQFVVLADCILSLNVPGPLVECGCFKGGGTAKLSWLAAHTGRRLYVCDSFAGLPEPESAEELRLTAAGERPSYLLAPGEFKGAMEEVQAHVRQYGCIDVCQFVPGFFDHSLAGLDIHPALVFIDVDYVSSARACLKQLWPRLVPGGYWFTHEASFPHYIHGMLDVNFWETQLGECPPVMIGAGTGLSLNASSIAFLQKKPVVVESGADGFSW
jgi:hypothetical protein